MITHERPVRDRDSGGDLSLLFASFHAWYIFEILKFYFTKRQPEMTLGSDMSYASP